MKSLSFYKNMQQGTNEEIELLNVEMEQLLFTKQEQIPDENKTTVSWRSFSKNLLGYIMIDLFNK